MFEFIGTLSAETVGKIFHDPIEGHYELSVVRGFPSWDSPDEEDLAACDNHIVSWVTKAVNWPRLAGRLLMLADDNGFSGAYDVTFMVDEVQYGTEDDYQVFILLLTGRDTLGREDKILIGMSEVTDRSFVVCPRRYESWLNDLFSKDLRQVTFQSPTKTEVSGG